jgi:hypothetical protein
MLLLIFEDQHQRALLRHVSSEQFHWRLRHRTSDERAG